MFKRIVSIMLSVLIIVLFTVSTLASGTPVWTNKPSGWALEGVKKAISLKIIPKDMQGKYNKYITRQEFCRLIICLGNTWNTEGKTETVEGIAKERGRNIDKLTLSDTKDINVRLCVMLGIADVKDKGFYDPNSPITRQEAAKMLYETANNLTLLRDFRHHEP